jgi:parvulin-like peptidyl-prolyl isomerase
MSFRNRPVLDRKHRPRWQDELRTQQLVVAGFALAIAVAVGIFGATTWANHYNGHLRQVAYVNGRAYAVDDLSKRIDAISAELQSAYLDLQGQLGGMRDAIINQQLTAIQNQLDNAALISTATESLVLERALGDQAAQYGISVSGSDLDAEVARRKTLPERMQISVISFDARPEDAAAGQEPTDADWQRALDEAGAAMDKLEQGGDFIELAKAESDDPSAANGGLLGWIEADDFIYQDYFAELDEAGSQAGDLLGPTKDDSGYHILHLDQLQAAGPDELLQRILDTNGLTDAEYRTYVRSELLRTRFRDHFENTVMVQWQPQRQVEQIVVALDSGQVVPKTRVRHYLAQPLPGESDQSKATDAQWAAALERAKQFRAKAVQPNADWFEIAADSDDPGSAAKGGDLGWYDPKNSPYVTEFTNAANSLEVGQISQPVKSAFGYHVIEVTDTRLTALDAAEKILARVTADPDSFGHEAHEFSEDANSAKQDGDIGWVIPYQLAAPLNQAIFEMDTPGQISDIIESQGRYYIFKVVAVEKLKWVTASQLETVRQTGFQQWLAEVRAGAQIWVDPAFSGSTAG